MAVCAFSTRESRESLPSCRAADRLAERVGEILKICWSKPTHFWVGLRWFVHLQGTPYDNSGKISLMCLKMARSSGPKSSKFVGELLVFSRVGQKPTRSASLAAELTIQIELTRGMIQRPLTNARTHDATPPSSTTTSKQSNQQTLPNDRSLFGISLPSTEKIPFANRNNEIH